jgi:hypothetical protein
MLIGDLFPGIAHLVNPEAGSPSLAGLDKIPANETHGEFFSLRYHRLLFSVAPLHVYDCTHLTIL